MAHAALDRQRRAVSLESGPLTRLLAELVLRPPDLRHLDAAFQAMGASPHGATSLRMAVGDPFATRCPSCERMVVADEFIWSTGTPATPTPTPTTPTTAAADAQAQAATPTPGLAVPASAAASTAENGAMEGSPVRKQYRCHVCRGQRGGGDQRSAVVDAEDIDRARAAPEQAVQTRDRLRDRFPVLDGGDALIEGLLDLHTPRQLAGLEAILERVEGDLRAAPVEAALRLGFLHALMPASRLNGFPGRIGSLRIQGGRVRVPGSAQWRERNPWLAFEDGIRLVRGFIQRLEGGSYGSVQARIGEDLRSLADGTATAVLRVAGPSTGRALGAEAEHDAPGGGRMGAAAAGGRRRIRLVLGQPPVRPNQERLSLAYWATAWVIGREAAATLPIEALSGAAIRAPWGWHAAALGRALADVEPSIARDGRVVFLVDGGGPEALVAAALGGVEAGFRLVGARLEDGDDEIAGVIELVPPGAVRQPGPRTRGNLGLGPTDDGSGEADLVPGPGLLSPPERFDRRPFSPADVARTVTDVAVETIKARGEPARHERILGEILVGLDRAGQLRRLVAAENDEDRGEPEVDDSHDAGGAGPDASDGPDSERHGGEGPRLGPWDGSSRSIRTRRSVRQAETAPDRVERILALIGGELTRPTQRRLSEIEPGRWWLTDSKDREAAAVPLADRVEWAVYSLLSTAGPLSETAFFERMANLFVGHDLPDEALVRACLRSYRSMASTADRLVTADDLLGRAQQHAETIAALADGGHRLGMSVWIGQREQARRLGSRRLADWLDDREARGPLGQISRAADEVADVDCIWYVRGRAALLFEVEWTAMLGEPMLRRHARIPHDDSLVRFLVVAPERTELVQHKLERSPLLREAVARDNWHFIKWNNVGAFLRRDPLDLADLEPYIGLEPLVERSGEQMPLFEG